MKQYFLKIVCAAALSLGLITAAQSAVIPAHFGMNFVAGGVPGGPPVTGLELQLLNITYVGGGGSTVTTSIPAFPGTTPVGSIGTGLPDNNFGLAPPTYLLGGDGETTRTYGATAPIDWDMTSFAFPSIAITDIALDIQDPTIGGTWTAAFATPYIVGLIPLGPDTELASTLPNPQGDIYGNPIGAVSVTSTPAGFENLVGLAFGDFIFAAATPVPLPAAVWLFGSGLLGILGIARRKKAA